MDQSLIDFIRDRFESIEASQTGIHRKLDGLHQEQLGINDRLVKVEATLGIGEFPKPKKAGFWTTVATVLATAGYTIYEFIIKKP
jgi:hypothetical protein